MSECIFCKIVSGDIPCTKVYEDDAVLAFEDIHPMVPVHVIIIPKTHVATLLDVDVAHSNLFSRLFAAAQQVAEIKNVAHRGFRTVINCNAEGGQVVFHLHMHLLGGQKLDDRMG